MITNNGRKELDPPKLSELKNPRYRVFNETRKEWTDITPVEAAELRLSGWEPDVDACRNPDCVICAGTGIVIMREPA